MVRRAALRAAPPRPRRGRGLAWPPSAARKYLCGLRSSPASARDLSERRSLQLTGRSLPAFDPLTVAW